LEYKRIGGIAGIGSSSGVVTGTAAGTVMVTYTLSTGCITNTTITVNALPMLISGTANVCAGLTTNLTDGTSAGVWSSGVTSIAAVGSATGIVTGVAAGGAIITYMLVQVALPPLM